MSMDMAQIQKIKDAFTEGTITIDEVERRLEEAIDTACESDHADPRFIEACEDLLWELNTAGTQEFKSHNDQYLKAIQKKAQAKRFSQSFAAPAIKFAAVAAAVIVVVMCLVNPPTFTWLKRASTANQQQYVIHGNEITVDLITRCIAENNDKSAKLQTSDWNEVVEFLGFAPSVPNPTLLDFDSIIYSVFVEPDRISIYAQYIASENKGIKLLYTAQYFTDADEARFSMEQNKTGNYKQIQDCMVYLSENNDYPTYMWEEEITLHAISGNVKSEIRDKIMLELIGGSLDVP